jgi:hypothetical protein
MPSFIQDVEFTKGAEGILSDDELLVLEIELIKNPEAGDLIKGGKGIRKIRVASGGKGKSGGSRVIYYWQVSDGSIFLLAIYSKSKKSTISPKEIVRLTKKLGL